jgi:hypothetical protein
MTADDDDSLLTVLANEGLLVYSCASRMGSAPASATFRDWQREMCQSKCVRAVCALQLHHQHCHGFSTCSLARTADLKTSNRDSHSGTRSRGSFAWSLRLRRWYHREYVQQDDSFRPQSLLARWFREVELYRTQCWHDSCIAADPEALLHPSLGSRERISKRSERERVR